MNSPRQSLRVRLALLLLLLPCTALPQAATVPTQAVRRLIAGVPLPASGPCPSVVSDPTENEELLLGTFRLKPPPHGVVDGDTIRVVGLDRSLRLIGIDTEETFKDRGRRLLAVEDWPEYLRTVNAGADPERPPKYGTPMGEAAAAFTRHFFRDVRHVRLEYDDPSRRRGYYGRHLVHVLARSSGRLVDFNVEVVRQGFSPYFVKYGRSRRSHAAFEAAEEEARAAGRGIWAERPTWRCYPDYEARLAWWRGRDQDLRRIEGLKAERPRLVLLGEEGALARLEALEGRQATVAGVPGRLVRKGDTGLWFLGHRQGRDFVIAGPHEAVAALGLEEAEGDHVLLSGLVSLHRGRPQFRVETVSWERVPREAR